MHDVDTNNNYDRHRNSDVDPIPNKFVISRIIKQIDIMKLRGVCS